MAKMQTSAKMGALSKLMSVLDAQDRDSLHGSKPFGEAGDKNPLEKSGMEGDVAPREYFAKGGMIDEESEGSPQAEMGSGNHDETSGSDFASAWEELTGKTYRRHKDQEGLGGESAMDGSGVDAASEPDMSDEDKAKLTAAYEKHVLGKR